MNVLLLEPFFTGSHASWAKTYAHFSQHKIEILQLPGKYWKWRMHGGAVTLAQQFMDASFCPDLILATDMLDVCTFLALTQSKSASIPTALYFHENQLTYPWSPTDADVQLKRDNHYSFINYTSALAADALFFNSQYHLHSFTNALPAFLKQFPDYQGLEHVAPIKQKSQVLHLGLNLQQFSQQQQASTAIQKNEQAKASIVWNHRWEYDKNPEDFFKALFILSEKGLDFNLVVLGESYAKKPPIFKTAKAKLQQHIIHWGYTDDFTTYINYLWQADLLPVTANQDFFGGSVVQALYCNCYPILPKRLAYPEHLPTHLHEKHYYTNFDTFVNLLENAIVNIAAIRTNTFQQYVQHYDWQQIVGRYDDAFEKVCKR